MFNTLRKNKKTKISYKDKTKPIFDEFIQNYSSEIFNIINNIKNSDGIIFVFLNFLEEFHWHSLEHAGFKNINSKYFRLSRHKSSDKDLWKTKRQLVH